MVNAWLLRSTWEVEIWLTRGRIDAHLNKHRIGPRKIGPARKVPTVDRIKQGSPTFMGDWGTDVHPNENGARLKSTNFWWDQPGEFKYDGRVKERMIDIFVYLIFSPNLVGKTSCQNPWPIRTLHFRGVIMAWKRSVNCSFGTNIGREVSERKWSKVFPTFCRTAQVAKYLWFKDFRALYERPRYRSRSARRQYNSNFCSALRSKS